MWETRHSNQTSTSQFSLVSFSPSQFRLPTLFHRKRNGSRLVKCQVPSRKYQLDQPIDPSLPLLPSISCNPTPTELEMFSVSSPSEVDLNATASSLNSDRELDRDADFATDSSS